MQPSKYEFYLQISLTAGDDNSAQINPPFFGCIFKKTPNGTSNEGCGWSQTPEQAFHDAYRYFDCIPH